MEWRAMLRIRNYQIIDCLGKGSTGIVFLAYDSKRKIHVAVKTIRMTYKDYLERNKEKLCQESYLLKKMQGKGVPRYIDFFFVKKIPYLVMEYIEGVTLMEYVGVSGPLSIKEIIYIAERILNMIRIYTDVEFGICHGDISPQNIMLTSEKEVKMIDFGNGKKLMKEEKYSQNDSDFCCFGDVLLFLLTGTLCVERNAGMKLLADIDSIRFEEWEGFLMELWGMTGDINYNKIAEMKSWLGEKWDGGSKVML